MRPDLLNPLFAEASSLPAIILLSAHHEPDAVHQYYRAAELCMVSSLHDGMNLVAKEYVAAQDPQDPGVLVLSTFAGAARELDSALLVNPYDLDGVADAIAAAAHMPRHERLERWQAMMDYLRANDINAWRRRYLEALAA